ncbi:MAG: YncE family protein [Bacteroidia bacterium]|nr:YncE family protein [Bacteroidia bacterium]MDW8347168.1 YncE family protein [Bacteroidia bacterium]
MRIVSISFIVIFLLLLLGCRKDKVHQSDNVSDIPAETMYPADIAKIMTQKCANTGCHDGKANPASLALNTWENAMKGASYGSVIMPYRPNLSYLFLHTNTYPSLGNSLPPIMPPASFSLPLDSISVAKIKNWISEGAPNKNGFVKFSDNLQRSKLYVVNSGCDLVTIIDAETNLQMRYIGVGSKRHLRFKEGNGIGPIQSPHYLDISPDKKYWYVTLIEGKAIEKYDAEVDSFVARLEIPSFGQVAHISITPDGTKGIISNYDPGNPAIAVVNLTNMTTTKIISGIGGRPHGLVFYDNNTAYVAGYISNTVYKIDLITGDILENIFTDNPLLGKNNTYPYDLMFNADKSRLYVSCSRTNEMIEINPITDMVTRRVNVGKKPLLFDIDKQTNTLLVACQDDDNPSFSGRGSVCVIELNSFTLTKKIFGLGNMPRVVRVHPQKRVAYVAVENFDGIDPPHHASDCAGNNGFVSIINLNTMDRDPSAFKNELSVQPIGMVVR